MEYAIKNVINDMRIPKKYIREQFDGHIALIVSTPGCIEETEMRTLIQTSAQPNQFTTAS